MSAHWAREVWDGTRDEAPAREPDPADPWLVRGASGEWRVVRWIDPATEEPPSEPMRWPWIVLGGLVLAAAVAAIAFGLSRLAMSLVLSVAAVALGSDAS